jgi:hypothetical protein
VHRDDGYAVGGEVTAAPLGQHLKREPVAHSLNQNDRPRPVITRGSIRGHGTGIGVPNRAAVDMDATCGSRAIAW